MTAITKSARGENCTIRVPGYCNGNPETTVFCHINGIRFGHGTGQKVSDILGAYGCSCCHDVVDGRQRSNFTGQELRVMHLEGMAETQLKLLAKGLIK